MVSTLPLTGTVVSLQQTLILPLLPEFPRLLETTADNASWLVMPPPCSPAVARLVHPGPRTKLLTHETSA